MTGSSIDRELLSILERGFAHHAGGDAVIDLADLQRALRVRNEYFARRVLAVLDRDGDGVVRKDEFLEAVRALIVGSDEDKLRFAFRLHDHDDNGALDRDELLRMIVISLAESESSERVTQTAEQLVTALMSKVDRDRDGRISFDELLAYVRTRPKLLAQMVRHEAIWIAPNEELLDWLDRRESPRATPVRERGRWVVLAVFAVANLALFAISLARGLAGEQQLPMALGRALARCLDFDGALILVPVMRRALTKVRATALGRVLPVDHAIELHKVVGHTMFGLALAHAAAFVVAWVDGHVHLERLLFFQRVGLTGLLLVAVFSLMWVCSLSFIRRSHRFELFYFTHLLYVAWFVLAIVHGPKFLLWAGVPLLGFVLEQVWRGARRAKPSRVVVAEALRSGVTRLELERPAGFRFEPGDYVFLRIPGVARYEWHPFTISSAPERSHLGFHVRALGNWTRALRGHVEEQRGPLTAFVDGPYGSPSAHIFRSRNVVLVGAGIGVTPFASVLESLVMRSNGESQRPSALQNVHFFWLNRDQYSFEWFGALLRELEARDTRGIMNVHLCMTGGRAGATSLGLELARDAMRSSGRSDFFTGLRTHTHLGQPDWEAMFRAIVQQHAPGQVDVFYCGPPGLAQKLRPVAEKLGMTFREEKF